MATSGLNELVTCSICLDEYMSPRRLPCPHSFCLECLRDLYKRDPAVIRCPECRIEHKVPDSGVDEFPVDLTLKRLLEVLDSKDVRCEDRKGPGGIVRRQLRQIERRIPAESVVQELTEEHGKWKQSLADIDQCIVDINHCINLHEQELEATRARLMSQLTNQRKQSEKRLSDLSELLAVKEFHVKARQLLAEERPDHELVVINDQCRRVHELLNQLEQTQLRASPAPVVFVRDDVMVTSLLTRYGEIRCGMMVADYSLKHKVLNVILGANCERFCDRFKCLRDVAICSATDDIYVSDDDRIHVYKTDGTFVRSVRLNYCSAYGIVINADGHIIASDFDEDRVHVYNQQGGIVCRIGKRGTGDGQFRRPWGVTCDGEGIIYVADRDNHQVQVFSPLGQFIRRLGQEILKYPLYVAVDRSKQIYVTDLKTHQVYVFCQEGKVLKIISGAGGQHFKEPRGLCLDKDGRLLVIDTGNRRIVILKPSGDFECNIKDEKGSFSDIMGVALTAEGLVVVTECKRKAILIIGCC